MTDALIAEHHMRRLLATYSRAADRLDRELLASVFHDDAEIDLGAIFKGGPTAFLDVVERFMGAMAATRHDIGNVLLLDAGPARAAAESYVQAWHRVETPEGTRELTVYGRYLTVIEERADRWAIASHSEVIDWAREAAADPAWFDGNAEMPKGRRDREDASYALLA